MDPLRAPLSLRLQALYDAIPPGSRVADVGSGHGLLPLALTASGRAAYCLATEKTEGLLLRVRRPPAGSPGALSLAFRAGDGLDAILPADRIDTIVLAGMGSRTIVGLLRAPQAENTTVLRLVLQPRSEPAVAREWLSAHGWRPVAERLTESNGRFHLTLTAERGDEGDVYRDPLLTREDLLVAGPLLTRRRPAEFSRYWLAERDRLASIVAGSVSGPGSTRARSGLARAERLLAVTSTPGG